jgi:restriction system protein
MTGKHFELYVRDQLIARGYKNVETTRASGDMGADLIVRQNGKVIVVQCKRYGGAVGIKAVQEVLGAKSYYGADEAWVVTDSTFTLAAKRLARSAKVSLKMLVSRTRTQDTDA